MALNLSRYAVQLVNPAIDFAEDVTEDGVTTESVCIRICFPDLFMAHGSSFRKRETSEGRTQLRIRDCQSLQYG